MTVSLTLPDGAGFALTRPPQDEDELHALVELLWGISLPRVQVCPGHVAPFTAFSNAYFSRHPNYAVWYGSRGTGKSLMLAILALTKAILLDVDVTLLGGSMAQSANVHEHNRNLLRFPRAPEWALSKNIATEILTNSGAYIRPLPASQTTVRGPHPNTTLLDEVDEMEYDIYKAAMGQAMQKPNAKGVEIPEYVVASSTWQNVDGCVLVGTPVLTRSGDLPIEQIVAGDQVWTRDGWRTVEASLNMGDQPTLEVVTASGHAIRCTPWHPFWVVGHGWVRADALAPGSHVLAHVLPSAVSEASLSPTLDTDALLVDSVPLDESLVPVGAGVVGVVDGSLAGSSSPTVFRSGDDFQVSRVDASSLKAQVIDFHAVGYGSDDDFVDPTVSEVGTFGAVPPAVLQAVSGVVGRAGPDDTFVGFEVEGYSVVGDPVVSVSHTPIVVPTWDLTVEGTHEYVAGGLLVHNTFTKVLNDARERGMPVYTWCWREVTEPHGWMKKDFIERKKLTVPAEFWRVEYELGEPSGESSAFDVLKIQPFFKAMEPVETRKADSDTEYVFAHPVPEGSYAAGADWAKSKDHTVITVVRTDVEPHPVVYWRKVNRRDWPTMIEMFNDVTARYQAVSAHDATGLGGVITDYVDERTLKVVMTKQKRMPLMTEYIVAVERGEYLLPEHLFNAHKATTVDAVFGGSEGDHLPDEIVSLAMAHRAGTRVPSPTGAQAVKRTETPPKWLSGMQQTPNIIDVVTDGDVRIADERSEVGVFWL